METEPNVQKPKRRRGLKSLPFAVDAAKALGVGRVTLWRALSGRALGKSPESYRLAVRYVEYCHRRLNELLQGRRVATGAGPLSCSETKDLALALRDLLSSYDEAAEKLSALELRAKKGADDGLLRQLRTFAIVEAECGRKICEAARRPRLNDARAEIERQIAEAEKAMAPEEGAHR